MAIDVGIVDDHAIWLSALRDTVVKCGFSVSITETNPAAYLALARARPPDVSLVDLRMPPSGEDEGIHVAEELRRAHPTMGIVLISGLESELRHRFIERRMNRIDGPPLGFLYKDRVTPSSLRADLWRIVQGESVVDSVIASDALDSVLREGAGLTEDEERVMTYMAAGWTNRQITKPMMMSIASVDRLTKDAFEKLLARHRDQEGENKRVLAVREWLHRRGGS